MERGERRHTVVRKLVAERTAGQLILRMPNTPRMPLRAVLWDVDGTIAETERDGHRVAFNRAFERHDLPWRWSVAYYGELLAIAGGRERALHDMESRPDAPPTPEAREALARALHVTKNAEYAHILAQGEIVLRPGVRDLMHECRARGLRMGITTTTSRDNIDALLGRQLSPDWRDWFEVVLAGEDVSRKKPDPEVYERALQLMGLAPHEAVALEDSPAGVAAARGAHIPVVVARSVYFTDVPLEGALAIGPSLGARDDWSPSLAPNAGRSGVGVDDLVTWLDVRG